MKRFFLALALALGMFLAGCASGPGAMSPEAQIAAGAQALTATTTLAVVALKNDKITVAQAKSMRVMLGAAGSALDEANAVLVACRAKQPAPPVLAAADPCRPAVADIIILALDSIANVKRSLDQK